MIEQDPPLDPASCTIGSIFDAVMMCVNHDQWVNEGLRDDMTDDDTPTDAEGNAQYVQGLMLGQRAHDQSVLMLVFKECINQIEAMQLELALQRESGK